MRHEPTPLILNVSQDSPQRSATTRVLRKVGYDVLEAATGLEALRLAEGGPQLILLDANLADIDGAEVRRRIKANARTAAIPVVHVSAGCATVAERFAALDEGADGCLTQPIDPADLVATVRTCLRLKAAEDSLRQRESSHRTLVDSASDGIFCANVEGRFVDVNVGGCQMLGYTSEELLRLCIADIVGAEEIARVTPELVRLHAGEVVHSEWMFLRKDGTSFPGDVGATVLPDGRLLGIVRDITERRRLEQLRRNRESELTEIQRIAGMGSWRWTPATGAIHWSEGVKLILRRDPALPTPTFDTLAAFYTPDSWERLMEASARVIETGSLDEVEVEMVRDDGTTCWTATRGEALRGKDGAILAIRGTVHDIDERKRAELAVEEARHFNEAVVDSMPGLFYLVDEQGHLLRWNSNFEKASGYSADEISGMSVPDFIDAPDMSLAVERMQQVFSAGEAAVEAAFVAKDQTRTRYLFSGRRFMFDGKPCLIGLGIDITERTRTESELRLQSAALNAAANAIAITDRNGTIVWINQAFSELTGYSSREAVASSPRELLRSGVHDQTFYKRMWDTILAGSVWHGELTNRRKDGSLYPEDMVITPVKNAGGEITHFIAIKRDLTEERRLEARFLLAQKLEAVGTLAGGIAHDFNNILGAMLGCTEMAAMDAVGNQAVLKNLAQVTAAGQRATELVRHIMAFTGQQDQARLPIHLESAVKEALALLRASLPSSVELRGTFDQTTPAVLADPTSVHQIVMNLGINAWHAMEGRPGTIEVSLDGVGADRKRGRSRAARYARLSVRDTGRGMDRATQARIFEPFFTTKAPGEGTGLGLATVHGIMKSYEGEISVSSQPGAGTTFQLFFPAIDDAAENTNVVEAPVPRGDGQHILLVDDEASLVAWGSAALERLGYRVTGRASVVDALGDLSEDARRFDLVITDLTMPAMTGIAFAERVRFLRADLPVIFMTGNLAAVGTETLEHYGLDAFLAKPVAIKTLARTVHRVLQYD